MRSGPPAQPGSARSDLRRTEWTLLPAHGRGGRRAPNFPLGRPSKTESALWTVLWKKPQAVMWEQLGLEFQVAAFARAFVQSTETNANASLKTAVLRMEDGLGISPSGLRALRWQIDDPAPPVAPPVVLPTPVRRLRAVQLEKP